MAMSNRNSCYRIQLVTGDVVNAGYRIYKESWQTHRSHKPIKSKSRRPRWKFISVWPTEEEAKLEIDRLTEEL